MLDGFLKAASTFDWISPAWSVLDEVFRGPVYTFLIDYKTCPLSGREIVLRLKKKKVAVGTTMIVGDTIMINVRMKSAVAAQIELTKLGVPVTNPLPRKKRQRKAVKREAKKPRKRKPRGSYQCRHCESRYLRRHTKCSNCGAPM